MKILAIDTSSKVLSLALSEDSDIIAEESHLLDKRHSSLLIPKIEEILEKADLSIDSVDAFVIGLGPGSFTGLRIGVSAVKGFGVAAEKPCVGVPSIDAMALNADGKAKTIIPLIDAKRQQVYSAIYKEEKGNIIRKSGYLLLNVDKLMKRVKCPALFFGDGVPIYKEKIRCLNKKADFLSDEKYWYPRAANLIKPALGKIKRYRRKDLTGLRPMYLYPKDCQVKK